jgi:16S rRNA (uracil1498-N3)-methyltransferase
MYHLLKRVYTESKIPSSGDVSFCNKDKIHHITKVLRLRPNDSLILFNEVSGEFLVQIKEAQSKSEILFTVKEHLRKSEKEKNINIAFSPIKQDRLRFLIEKCTEIGCSSFYPVITERSVIRKISVEKLRSYSISASEQSGRIRVPEIYEVQGLSMWLKNCKNKVLFCDEFEKERMVIGIDTKDELSILIGPEGGFTDKERELLTKNDNVINVSLGKNILRSETAAIFALSAIISN